MVGREVLEDLQAWSRGGHGEVTGRSRGGHGEIAHLPLVEHPEQEREEGGQAEAHEPLGVVVHEGKVKGHLLTEVVADIVQRRAAAKRRREARDPPATWRV